jgi:hypothetical protein
MNINWEEIKEVLSRDIGNTFKTGSPAYPDLDEGMELFYKVIFSTVGGFGLDGLKRELPNALQDACKNKVGELEPLRVIATCLDAYLKKLCVIVKKETSISVQGKTLRPLLERLDIISTTTPSLREPILPSTFIGQPNYLEFICDAYQTRNKVHESPNFRRSEVISRLTNVLITYIFASLKYKNEINLLPPQNLNSKSKSAARITREEKYLYHFISYGSTTNKIKNQIITSFILNYLQDLQGLQSISIEDMKTKCNNFFKSNDLQLKYYTSLFAKLEGDKKILIDKQSQSIRLTQEEKNRIEKIQSDFETNKNIFFLYLEDIKNKYQLSVEIDELYSKLEEFIEDNYNIDMAEAYDKGVDIGNDENKLFQIFIAYLSSIINDRNSVNQLFKDLIELSKDSDFLLRMCAGRTFAKLTNPDRFEHYANQQDRIVYLDTQIILFALCLNYVNKAKYQNHQYEVTEELLQLSKQNKNILLKVSRLYVNEVAYQLKMALMLIPFEEIAGKKISNNVFYQFYWHLKENDLLEEKDNSFSDFMASWFELYEEDAYENTFRSIAYSNIISYLEDDALSIEVETIQHYDNIYEASDIIRSVLNLDYKDRPKNVVDNDAAMLCHLCNSEIHQVEPFFLTWDKEFVKFRKKFIENFKRADVMSFHLFNPSKFINHVSLLKFKINPHAMSNGLISILDSYNIHENTFTIWDVVNKYLNVDNIKSTQRRKHIQSVKNIFEQEFGYALENLNDPEKSQDIAYVFEETLSKINEYFLRGDKYKMSDYKQLILSDDYFNRTTSIILKGALEKKPDTVIEKINELIHEYKNA